MKLPIMLVLLLVAVCSSSNAQQNKTTLNAWRFQSVNTVGLIIGQGGGAMQVVSVNGVQHGTWFGGIGVGVDGYGLRSIPLFAELRKTISHNFFAYTGAGVNWYWKKDADIKQFYNGDNHKAGFFGEAGLGYAIKLRKHSSLFFSGGYSFKKLVEEGYDYWYGPGFPDMAPPSLSKVNYNLHRLEIKAGIAF